MKIFADYFHFIDQRYRYEGEVKYEKSDKLLKYFISRCIFAFYASIKDLRSDRKDLS